MIALCPRSLSLRRASRTCFIHRKVVPLESVRHARRIWPRRTAIGGHGPWALNLNRGALGRWAVGLGLGPQRCSSRQFWLHACVRLHALPGDTPVSGYTPCLVTRRVWFHASVCLHDVSSYAPVKVLITLDAPCELRYTYTHEWFP